MLFLSDIEAVLFFKRSPHENPRGGLTPAGRKYYLRQGHYLRPGVTRKGKKMSMSDMRRKSSFLMRFYGNKNKPPLVKPNGELTRHSKAASAWGERPPRNQKEADLLYQKGKRLNERYKKRRDQ